MPTPKKHLARPSLFSPFCAGASVAHSRTITIHTHTHSMRVRFGEHEHPVETCWEALACAGKEERCAIGRGALVLLSCCLVSPALHGERGALEHGRARCPKRAASKRLSTNDSSTARDENGRDASSVHRPPPTLHHAAAACFGCRCVCASPSRRRPQCVTARA